MSNCQAISALMLYYITTRDNISNKLSVQRNRSHHITQLVWLYVPSGFFEVAGTLEAFYEFIQYEIFFAISYDFGLLNRNSERIPRAACCGVSERIIDRLKFLTGKITLQLAAG